LGQAAYTSTVTAFSAVLIAHDEESNIRAALESVSFCEERVVVDSGSTDRTREVAETAGARVILNTPWPGFVAQRNFAVERARHDWILALDADERITPALRAEIESLRARELACAAYRIPRAVFYMGRWIRATDWNHDSQIRIFDRKRARWDGGLVHESVRVEGSIGRLHAPMEHYPYADISAHMRKIDRYTTLWARQAFAAGQRTSTLAMALIPLWTFLRNYVLRRGLLLGQTGLTISTLNTYYTYLKLAKLAELARNEASSTPR
jgi:glycosyltransferase involved in cell wall biosynthesis